MQRRSISDRTDSPINNREYEHNVQPQTQIKINQGILLFYQDHCDHEPTPKRTPPTAALRDKQARRRVITPLHPLSLR